MKIPAVYAGKSKLGSVKDFNKIQMDGENVEHRAPQLQRKGTYRAIIKPWE
jgi:hypothetical protein